MSVVCAKVYEDRIEFASDSILVNGWTKNTQGDFSKMVTINNMIIGSTGTAVESSLMWHFAKTHRPESPTERDVLTFVAEFSKWKRENYGQPEIGNTYLLAYEGKLFLIEKMFVYEVTKFQAVGAGEDFALAVMHMGNSARDAVQVACDLSCFVAEPIIQMVMLKTNPIRIIEGANEERD